MPSMNRQCPQCQSPNVEGWPVKQGNQWYDPWLWIFECQNCHFQSANPVHDVAVRPFEQKGEIDGKILLGDLVEAE